MERVEALSAVESGMLPPLAAHCHPRVPTGCPRMAQHNPIQSVCWHCPHKSRSGTLALLQIRVGKRVGAPAKPRRVVPLYDDIKQAGSRPTSPVQAQVKYALVINLNTAKALGLTVPPTLLAIADE